MYRTHLNVKLGHAQEGVRYIRQNAIGRGWVQIPQRGIRMVFQPVINRNV